MKTVQLIKKAYEDWGYVTEKTKLTKPLVLVFGDRFLLENKDIYPEVRQLFPDGEIVFGSSCADITASSVNENSISITAIEFEKSTFDIKTSNVSNIDYNSFKTGNDLIEQFPQEGLKYVFVISEGSFVNGSQLTKGMNYWLSKTPRNLVLFVTLYLGTV